MIPGFSGAGPKPAPRIKKPKRRPPRVSKRPSRQAELKADAKWAKAVGESGPCAALGIFVQWVDSFWNDAALNHGFCIGPITAAHVMSRRYAATRTDKRNGLPLCLTVHDFFTAHPIAWDAFVVEKIGRSRYEALRKKALAGPKSTL